MNQKNALPDWINKHLEAYARSPLTAHFWDGSFAGGKPNTPTLLLTTTGRKSGRQITTPLIYGVDSGRYIVIASKGGAPEHPAWFVNLSAHPSVHVQVAEKKFTAQAATASGAESERLWAMMTAIYPPYPSYQQRTQRAIPVVVLQPLG